MKKSILLIAAVFGLSFAANSQTYFNIIDPGNGNAIVNDTYIEIQGSPTPSGDVMEKSLYVQNITGASIDVGMTRTEVDVETGTKNTTCWYLCPLYINSGDQVVYTAPFDVTIASQEADSSFSAKIKPEGVDGCSLFKYEFFNSADPAQKEVVYIKFFHNTGGVDCSTLDVIENNPNLNKVTMYPNPAVNNVKVNIENNVSVTSLVIVDMLGKTVKTVNTTNKNGVSNIDVSNLNQGFYFLKVMDGSKILQSKKLVINK